MGPIELMRECSRAAAAWYRDPVPLSREEEHRIFARYRSLYRLYSDEDLLEILKLHGEDLGHAPRKQDMFVVHRLFIKQRFGPWPTALRLAGLKPPKKEKNNNERTT